MFAETQDQQLFAEASRRFVESSFPVARVRELAGEGSTFDPASWRAAAELGWTTLLVPEDAGGGSVSGNGLADLLIVAALLGEHAAPGPLFGTNLVAAALGHWGSPAQRQGPLTGLLAGTATAAWGQASAVAATGDGDDLVLSGRADTVEGASDAEHLLVAAEGAGGRSLYLVPARAPGIEAVPLRGIDLTRRYQDVVLHGVAVDAGMRVGRAGEGPRLEGRLLDLAAVLAAAEIAGTLARAFAMTSEWLANRYSFGRPLNSYQEVKHRMADIRTCLEATEAVAARAATAVGTGAADATAWASAAMAYAGRHGPEAIQDCVQLHGGIGVTYDHDLHLVLRRATVDAHLFGSHADFARRLGTLVVTTEGAAP